MVIVSIVLSSLDDKLLTGLNMRVYRSSDSELWLEALDGFISVKIFVDYSNREILYDVFSPRYDVYLREENLGDVEKLDSIAEINGKWEHEKSIEGLWLALDRIRLWARKNRFNIRETRLI
jgi:hypothetical protein